MYKVIFINERSQRVEKFFDSLFLCRKFVNRLKHSKKCKLVSYPLLDWCQFLLRNADYITKFTMKGMIQCTLAVLHNRRKIEEFWVSKALKTEERPRKYRRTPVRLAEAVSNRILRVLYVLRNWTPYTDWVLGRPIGAVYGTERGCKHTPVKYINEYSSSALVRYVRGIIRTTNLLSVLASLRDHLMRICSANSEEVISLAGSVQSPTYSESVRKASRCRRYHIEELDASLFGFKSRRHHPLYTYRIKQPFYRRLHIGVSPSGKARDFDSLTRGFESRHPNHCSIMLHLPYK